MGNLSFIVPTKKTEEFNINKVYELITKKFPELTLEIDKNTIQVRDKNDVLIEDIFFNEDIYILNYENDIKELRKMNMDKLSDWLLVLKDVNPDLNNVIQTTYGYDHKMKNDIDFLIKDYFTAFLFDEGIHPEFMAPDYKRKIKKQKQNFFQKVFKF